VRHDRRRRVPPRPQLDAARDLDRPFQHRRTGARRRGGVCLDQQEPPHFTTMNTLATGLSYIDLQFLGFPRIIATAVLHGPGGVALVDPGPSTTLPTLRRELERAGITM